MKRANRYSGELKEEIICECQKVGNVALVARPPTANRSQKKTNRLQ